MKQAEARVDKQNKNYRIMRKQARQRDEELGFKWKGVTYKAGGFNDLGPSSGPPRKRKKTNRHKIHFLVTFIAF